MKQKGLKLGTVISVYCICQEEESQRRVECNYKINSLQYYCKQNIKCLLKD